MLEAYSNNITVTADQAIPFNNLALKKGCTVELVTPTTIQFNKCGVYNVRCNVSAATESTIQLFKSGTEQPQSAQTGTNPSIDTLVAVDKDNSCNPCVIPVTAQILCDTAGTLSNVNIVVTKLR